MRQGMNFESNVVGSKFEEKFTCRDLRVALNFGSSHKKFYISNFCISSFQDRTQVSYVEISVRLAN